MRRLVGGREHLAGAVAVAICEDAVQRGWIRRLPHTREVRLTPPVPAGLRAGDRLERRMTSTRVHNSQHSPTLHCTALHCTALTHARSWTHLVNAAAPSR